VIKNLPYDKILNYLILLYAFFIPLSLDMLRILAISMVIIWIFYGNFKEKISLIKQESFFYSIGLYILVLILALLWTEPENLRFGIKYFTRYWYLLPMLVIYTSLDKKYIFPTISAFLMGMLISELVSYGIFFNMINWNNINSISPSPFMQRTLYSIFLAFTSGILLYRTIDSKSVIHKIIYGLFFTTVTINLFINAGRTGYVLILFIIPTVIFVNLKFSKKSMLLMAALVIGIPYLALQNSPTFKLRILQTTQNIKTSSYSSSIGVRLGANIVAKDIFLKHPFLGVGTGDYLTEKEYIVDTYYPKRIQVKSLVHYHNHYAEILVIAGLLGLFSYLYILFSLFKIKLRNKEICTIKYLLLVTFTLSPLTDAIFHLSKPLSLFALFTGLILAQKRYEQLLKREE